MNETLDKTHSTGTLALHVTRVIRAKRHRVYDAWTKPELIGGDAGVTSATVDLKVGGSYRLVMSGGCGHKEDGDHTIVAGAYTEIIPNERLAFTWGSPGDPSLNTLVTVDFRDVAKGTEVSIRHERFENEAVRAQHEQGWTACLDNLEKYVAATAG